MERLGLAVNERVARVRTSVDAYLITPMGDYEAGEYTIHEWRAECTDLDDTLAEMTGQLDLLDRSTPYPKVIGLPFQK